MLVAAVCACGGGGSGSETDPDGGGGGNGGDGTSSPTETKAGMFTISSSRYTVSTTMVEQGYASGTMYRIPPLSSGGGGCTSVNHGACEVQTCVSGTTTMDGGLAITYTDSGPVTISGVEVNNGTMTLTPGGYGYATVSGAVALFNGGATVRWVAPGNASGGPGFDVSLVAPTAVQVTAPAFVQGKVTASATQDLAVTWSGATTSAVTAQLAAGTGGQSVVARCTFTGGTSGIVPAAALSAVRSAGGSASIMIMMESRATRMPDGWNLAFALQTYGLIPSGIAVGTLAIQ
jgi:hypothetical protein